MLRASKYRLYPNKQQRETLQWVLDRDHNAAINILRLGLQSIAKEARARTERSEDALLRSPRL
jgi:transposase